MKHSWLFPLLLTILVGLVFSPAFKADFVEYDDPAFVTKNGYVNQGFTTEGIKWAFSQKDPDGKLMHQGVANVWHPITWISHMLDVQLFGLDNPGGHHLHNILLHLISALLLYACILKLKIKAPLAILVATFFAIHPMRVESVAWISERKDVLSGAFFFATLLAYLHGKRAISVAFFILALMSKPSVVVLPGLFILLEWWRAGIRVEDNWKALFVAEVRNKLPWIAPAVFVIGTTLFFQYSGTQKDFVSPLGHRLFVMPASLLFYFWRTIWPLDLSFHYPLPAPRILIQAAIPIVVVLGIMLWKCRERFPHLFFGVAWFFILWLPTSGVFQVGSSFTADRYTYLAHAGLFLGILLTLRKPVIPGIVIVGIWSALSFSQAGVWKNSKTLFTHGTIAQPRDSVSWQNLAALHQAKGEFEKAISLHQKALELSPSDYISLYNLGFSYQSLGQLEKAADAFQTSLKAYPNYRPAHRALGFLFISPDLKESDPKGAVIHLEEAVRLSNYRDSKALDVLIRLHTTIGNQKRARELQSMIP